MIGWLAVTLASMIFFTESSLRGKPRSGGEGRGEGGKIFRHFIKANKPHSLFGLF